LGISIPPDDPGSIVTTASVWTFMKPDAPKASPKTVAVTGASGYLGRKLLDRLGSNPSVSRVIGIDVVEPDFSTRNLEFYKLDVRSPELADVISGSDALVHLAAINTGDAAETHDVNVTGTRAVVNAAGSANVARVVLASSHSVYGHHADNDYPLTEQSPVRPSPTYAYATSKAEAEQVLSYFACAHPEVAVAILRFAWVGGPSLPANAVIEAPIRLRIRGYDPETQAVHEDDAANAIVFALENDLRGTYNVCADDSVVRQEEIYGQRRVTIDLKQAKRMLDWTSKLGVSAPAAEIGMMMYPQVMSNANIKAAGFAFEHSTADAMRDSAKARREWVAIGRARFRPRRALLVGGTLGAVLLGSAAKRRRPRPAKA
jgi:UDP-glucose 4-epimerase